MGLFSLDLPVTMMRCLVLCMAVVWCGVLGSRQHTTAMGTNYYGSGADALSGPHRRALTSISPTLAQPDLRDRVHTIWMNGPTYPSKTKQPSWPPFGTGSVSSSSACDPSRSGYTGYKGTTAHTGYCSPASNDFNTDPWHLLIHSGRLGVVLDAAVGNGLIAKLGVVNESNADSSAKVYDALTAAILNFTLKVTKSSDAPDPEQTQCSGDHSCPAAYPECRDFIAGSQWGGCWGTTQESGSFGLGVGDKSNAKVQLVRQGHAVSHILATDLEWDVPVIQCEDIQEPRSNRGNVNCNQNFGSTSHPCIAEYPECRGFIQGSSWGKCWSPCIPGGGISII